MIDGLRLEYYQILYILVPLLIGAIIYRVWRYKPVIYRYSLSRHLQRAGARVYPVFKTVFFALRLTILVVLAFLIAKPQLPDKRTQTNVEGIDIVLALDASGSMMCFDELQDKRSRIAIAKHEALRFIDERDTDAIGLVVFGNGALSACPLTHDKTVLREILQQLEVGSMVDDRSTLLAHGLLTALNRLKNSESPSKIIILLTDGQPSMQDAPIQLPLSIAKQLGVKIYTIGVGDERGGYSYGPHGMLLAAGVQLNEQLLAYIAQQTGGAFYRARNAKEVHEVYSTIDKLEKRHMPVNVYARYYDIFVPFVYVIIALLALELGLAGFVWRHV